MKDDLISDEQLNAFLDNQLGEAERAQIIEIIQTDKVLAAKLWELRQLKEMVTLAYSEPTIPQPKIQQQVLLPRSRLSLSIAASIILTIGIVSGWVTHSWTQQNNQYDFYLASEFDPKSIRGDKILVHIDTMDKFRVQSAIHVLEKLLNIHEEGGRNLRLEVVANSEGLNFLRNNSPYADRISELAQQNQNLSFLACGIAMQRASIRDKSPVKLLPDARRIDAAIKRILSRVNEGWVYVKT